jgi:hypothetical protein
MFGLGLFTFSHSPLIWREHGMPDATVERAERVICFNEGREELAVRNYVSISALSAEVRNRKINCCLH